MIKMSLKSILLVFVLAGVMDLSTAYGAETQLIAQNKKTKKVTKTPTKKRRVKKTTRRSSPPIVGSRSANTQQALNQAISLARSGQYLPAASALFTLSRRPELAAERMQIRYVLGLMLFELKLNQVAAFQFVDVIRNGDRQYGKPSLEKLSVAADSLGDDTLLNYAISKVQLSEFPASLKDMLYFRMGEVRLKSGQNKESAELFSRVNSNSRYGYKARYSRGLALAEQGQTDAAIRVFRDLLNTRQNAPVTDDVRVAAQMALARAFYQKKDWDNSLAMYREIPRDHEMWHDALFESSWAMLRAAKFRSALSNFQSLHSAYYEDFYLPESLLLRSIVFLYICKYDEMDKVLTLFEKTYGPARSKMTDFIKSTSDPLEYYAELERAAQARRDLKKDKNVTSNLRMPYIVSRKILGTADVQRSLEYLKQLSDEQKRLMSMPAGWVESPIGKYAQKIINNRMRNTKVLIGDQVKAHIYKMRSELRDFYEQASFVRYEMTNGRKEQLKKKIAGKGLAETQIDEDADRTYYVQNGYEYWPFQGEYWLDEIGNYQYMGKQNCE